MTAFIAFAAVSSSYGLIAGLMTTYFGPGASGSGVAELVGYLNGVNYPNFLGFRTLSTKIIGIALAVNAKLVVGKEGPLAHIGTNLGAMVLYIPGLGFEFLRNDDKKRQYLAAGAAVGVSAAFGAPVGGTLFLYEFSKPNTFWTIDMISKVFFACCIGTLTLYACTNFFHIEENLKISSLKFGTGSAANENQTLYLVPHCIPLSLCGAFFGPIFIIVNTKVNAFRKKILTAKWAFPVETMLLVLLTSSVVFWYPYFEKKCLQYEGEHMKHREKGYVNHNIYSAFCEKEGHYN